MMKRFLERSRRSVAHGLYHLILSLGGILFTLPFLYLVSSSFKEYDELFRSPPQWLPSLPARVELSPYLHGVEQIERPEGMSRQIWHNIEPQLYRKVGERILTLNHPGVQATLPQNPSLLHTLCTEAIQIVTKKAGEAVAVKSADEIVEDLTRVKPLTKGEVEQTWGRIIEQLLSRVDGTVASLPILEIPQVAHHKRAGDLWPVTWTKGASVGGGYQWEERLQKKFATPQVWESFVFAMGGLLWDRTLSHRDGYLEERSPAEVIDFICRQIDPELLDFIWRTVYRAVLLGEMKVEHRDGTDIALLGFADLSRPTGLTEGLSVGPHVTAQERPGQEIRYRFGRNRTLNVTFPPKAPLQKEEVKQIVLPIRGDRSYHEISLLLNTGKGVYRSRKPFILENDRWMDAIWTFEKPTLREERTTYYSAYLVPLDLVDAHPSSQGPSITLQFRQTSYPRVLLRRFLKNYVGAVLAVPFLRYLSNTVLLTILNILAQLFSCSLVAYSFARLRWPGRDYVFGIVLATMMLPPQVTMIPQFLIWRFLGQYDTFQPLWVPSLFGSGFFIFLMRQFMLTIPRDLEDAAKIDGCGFLKIYWTVMLPLLKPALVTVSIFQFMATWNDFLGPLIYISSESKSPLSLGLVRFQGSHFVTAVGELGLLMAAGLLMILPIILLFFFAQRYFIQGVTLTGMKN